MNSRAKVRYLSGLVSAAILIVCGFPMENALAQDPASSTSEKTSGDTLEGDILEEVIVIARRREERLQDVPTTVRAFLSKEIENAGIQDIKGAFDLTSNAVIFDDQQPGVQTVTLRGITQTRGADAETGFAFVVDGVTSPTIFSLTQDLYDIERIEILKGPQGALYGRNAIGGAINIITKKPTNEFRIGGKVGFAEGNEKLISARVSGPLVKDKVLFRMAGKYFDRGGQLTNITLNRKVDFEEEYNIRGRLEIIPNDAVSISLSASYVNTDGYGPYYALDRNANTAPENIDKISLDVLSTASRKLLDLSAKIEWETTIGTFISVTAYTELDTAMHQDLDFTAISNIEAQQFVILDSWLQELRLNSPDDQRLRWSIGAFYQRIDRDIHTLVDVNADGPLGFLFGLGGAGDPATKDIRNLRDRTPMWQYDSYAVFGMFNYDLTEKLELSAGFRWDYEKRDFQQAGAAISVGDATFQDFQPTASLSYQIHDDATAYFTYSTGFRPGGFNSFVGISPDGKFDEETTENFEIGFKSNWYDRRLALNGAAFFIESHGTHLRLLSLLAGQAEFFNGGESEYIGFEIEAFAKPIDGLTLQAAFGYTDSEFTEWPTGQQIGNPPISEAEIEGKHVPRVYKTTLTLVAEYEMPLSGDLSLMPRVSYRRLGGVFWYPDNAVGEDAHEVVDLRLSLRANNWRVTGYLNNAFDEEWRVTYNNKQFEGVGVGEIHWPSPERQVGIQVSYEF